jgi:REP element-mobilizing transposase RayT
VVLGYHLVFGAYGFWLPNDPRGSWSEFVAMWDLLRYGRATTTRSRRSVAAAPHDRARRRAAKAALRYAPVRFTGRQALSISQGFRRAIDESGYRLHACAIMPDHVHLVVGRHAQQASRIIGHMKGRATLQLIADGLWPAKARPVWSERGWKVFLNDAADVHRAVNYVQRNPVRERLSAQRWSFVVPFELEGYDLG